MKKVNILSIIIILAIFAVILIPNIAYRNQFGSSISESKEEWGQYGDFIGGMTNPLLTIINIGLLIYLTYKVSSSDNTRLLSQMRYDAVRVLEVDFERALFLIKEENHEKTRNAFVELEYKMAAFAEESNVLFQKILRNQRFILEELSEFQEILNEGTDIFKKAHQLKPFPNAVNVTHEYSNLVKEIDPFVLRFVNSKLKTFQSIHRFILDEMGEV